ncbi:MAG: DUF4982 domain-containing protein [Lachnospiraceae bacterium]|nr:DUF4982 domain-containing protein [Lachnospiraceae bacterium]
MNQKIITLNEGWRFHYGDVPEAWYKGFDDQDWEEVFLPHDWSVHMPFRQEYSSGTGYLAGGVGWYRVRFSLPEAYRGKHIRIVFDGIYKNSRIWCNSYHLGKRPYGYSEISYDITELVNFGKEDNEISVQVTHTDLADSRWFTGSGIYRKVWLLVEEPVHPALHGIFFRTVSVESHDREGSGCKMGLASLKNFKAESDAAPSEDVSCGMKRVCRAHIAIRAEFANDSDDGCSLQAAFRLLDSEGQEAAAWTAPLALAAGESKEIALEGVVEKPHLWSVDVPYLYTLVTELSEMGTPERFRCADTSSKAKNWHFADTDCGEYGTKHKDLPDKGLNLETPETHSSWIADTQRVGIRTICFDPDEGFFLNGKNRKIKGVCVHHDGGCLGAAMTREVWLRRLLKLKAAGCNAIRTSHNPHMPELYDLCDELGFLMMDEAFDEWENPKNKWSTGHNVYPPKHEGYAEDFPQWYREDLTTMILRDRNHPSIVLWSVGNEIDYPNDPYCHPLFQTMVGNNDADKPAEEMMYRPDKPNARRLSVIAARLAGLARELDDSRPVTLAVAFPELTSRLGYLDSLDVVGYNYKEHLYEQDHARFPGKPFLGSENGHSYQAWRAVTDHPYISGQFLWTGIDYLGEAQGWPIHGSGAGLLDLAGYEKPEYYRRKAWWSEELFLCLLTACADPAKTVGGSASGQQSVQMSWNYEPGEMVNVYCYASPALLCVREAKTEPKAELFLNGKFLGEGSWNETDGRFEWRVVFEPGILKAVCVSGSTQSVNDGNASEVTSGGNVLEDASDVISTGNAPENAPSCSLETTGRAVKIETKVWQPDEAAKLPFAGHTGTKQAYQIPHAASDCLREQKPQERISGVLTLDAMPHITQIEVSLRDIEGRLVSNDDQMIYAETEGGQLLGLENGDLADLTSYTEPRRRTHNGRLILYVRSRAGESVTVKVNCEKLEQTVSLVL